MFWLFWPTVRGRLVWRCGWVKKEKGVITQMLDLCGWVVVRRLCQSKEILKKCKEIQNLKSKNPHKCWIFVGEVLLQGRARARNATVSQIPRLNTGCHSADIRERWANTKTSKSANTSTNTNKVQVCLSLKVIKNRLWWWWWWWWHWWWWRGNDYLVNRAECDGSNIRRTN